MPSNQNPWITTSTQLPPEDEFVEAQDSCGHIHKIKRRGNLWFFAGWSMYVYFTPVAWRKIDAE